MKHYVFELDGEDLRQTTHPLSKQQAIKSCVSSMERTGRYHYVLKTVESEEISAAQKVISEKITKSIEEET